MDLFKTSSKEVYAELMRSRKEIRKYLGWEMRKWFRHIQKSGKEFGGMFTVICWTLNVQSTVWETLHYRCAYFAQIAFNQSNVCMLCASPQNKRTHIFIECEVISEYYRHFLSFTDLLILALWKSIKKGIKRHQKLGNNKASIVRNLILKIDTFLKADLKAKFKLAVENQKLDEFRNKYLIDGILGTVDNNILSINNLYWWSDGT